VFFTESLSSPAQGILGLLNRRLPDGTMIWTAPGGQSYTTDLG
jgi:hypothetical protein